MNIEDSILFGKNNCNMSNPYLFGSTSFMGYVTFVTIAGKKFCEIGSSLFKKQKYYDMEEFRGTNIIHRLATSDFGNSANNLWELRSSIIRLAEGCPNARGHITHYMFDEMVMRELCSFIDAELTPHTLDEMEALEALESAPAYRIVANIHQVNATGKYIYIINNVAYSEYFPIEWALNHGSFILEESDGKSYTQFMGPGSSPNHCKNCNFYGAVNGVFVGYCANCAIKYNFTRGYGFIDCGIERTLQSDITTDNAVSAISTYLVGVDISTLGYHNGADDKYNYCLTGGELPTGPDICDNQDDMDPVREYEVDKCVGKSTDILKKYNKSTRYPRRAYGLPFNLYREVVSVNQTDEMTPDFIRSKLETFFVENGIQITNNNYSFPIGPRPEWDHYRVSKRPICWFSWIGLLISNRSLDEDVTLNIYLHLSNPHSNENPAKMILECNNVRGRSTLYWDMMRSMRLWILDETTSPIIDTPPLQVYEDAFDEDGELLPPPPGMY